MDRSAFYSTMETMLSLSENALLVDSFPPQSPHNVSARVLRLGLAVNAFASLEAYIADCFGRLISCLPEIAIPYESFPYELRELLLVKATEGVMTKGLRIKDKPSRLAFIQQGILDISSFSATPRRFSAFGFSSKGSNVESGDISGALRAFGVTEPWAKLSQITQLIGLSQIDLANAYNQLAQTRHQLAHNASSNIPSADLISHVRSAINIGISVDCLTSAIAGKYLTATAAPQLSGDPPLGANHFRFLDLDSDGYHVEKSTIGGAVVRRYGNLAEAAVGVAARIASRFVVRRDTSGRPVALLPKQGTGCR